MCKYVESLLVIVGECELISYWQSKEMAEYEQLHGNISLHEACEKGLVDIVKDLVPGPRVRRCRC